MIPAAALIFTACKDNTRTANSMFEVVDGVADYTVTLAKEKEKVAAQQAARVRERVVYTSTSTNSAKVQQKKGMSKSAKYAIVGGVGGAVIGGVATKSTKGAVIGGVIGAGTGYIIGRKKDKRSGRIQ